MKYVSLFLMVFIANCGPVHFQEPSESTSSSLGENERIASEEGDLVACVLVDHGKSSKLGMVGGALIAVNAVSESVCVSSHGCLDLVSAKFNVQGVYERGYCANNPNVTRLSDSALASLLD